MADDEAAAWVVRSPNGQLQATLRLGERQQPLFSVSFHNETLIEGSLGLNLAAGGELRSGFHVVAVRRATHDETYAIPVGKAASARDHHEELILSLAETSAPQRQLDIAFRAFDDGVAFRYLIPKQDTLADVTIVDELTELSFVNDPTAHLVPLDGYTSSYENYYESQPVSQINAKHLIGLPVLVEWPAAATQPIWLAVTEANLRDYAGLYLAADATRPGTLSSKLSPLPNRDDGAKVTGKTPLASPWRVLMIADRPGALIESNIIFNLSESSKISDSSWIKPGKTMFPWWNGYILEDVDFEPGLNTKTYQHYIDHCAKHGIKYMSLDGLETAWYGGLIVPDGPTDVTKAIPEIDLPELLRDAKEKGVRLRLWMHWRALKPQIDEAFALYEKWGIEGVMVDFMDRDDQEMVAFYHEMAEKAARHHLTLTLHGAYKPTGMERTWPNLLTSEAVLNQEYNKWGKGTPPRHNLDVAFIRMLAGPLDYHQGGMRNVLPEDFHPRDKAPPVQGTRGQQLAMYVVYENHLPMLADYPEAYRDQDGVDFLSAVPSNWDETRVLHAEFGKCIVIARRDGPDWYIGGMTAGEPRSLQLSLDFLGGKNYNAEVLTDDASNGPTAIMQRSEVVSVDDRLHLEISRDGGAVAHLSPVLSK